MTSSDAASLEDVEFDELESVDQYEATFTGTLDGEDVVVTYTLESAISADDEATVYTPGDSALDQVVVEPDTYEFEADDRETVRFTGSDDDEEVLGFVYALATVEDSDDNQVSLSVTSESQ